MNSIFRGSVQPLPSSPAACKRQARRSLDAGPADESAPDFRPQAAAAKSGAAPLVVTRAGDIPQSSRSSTKSLETPAARESSDVGTRLDSRREAVSKGFGGEKANEIKLVHGFKRITNRQFGRAARRKGDV